MSRWLRSVGIAALFVGSLGWLVGVALAGEAAAPAPAPKLSIEETLKASTTYKYGQSRAPLIAVTDLVRDSYKKPDDRKVLTTGLIAILGMADATPESKKFACQQLSIIGSAEAVPALTILLPQEEYSHMARTGLERIPGPEASKALRDALGQVKGKLLIGVIGSIGERRDAESASALVPFLQNEDPAVAAAAAGSLGKIGGDVATNALADARTKAPAKARTAVADGFLRCADHLLAGGKAAEAAAIYLEMYAPTEPKQIRIAALRGLVVSKSPKAMELISACLTGQDAEMQAVATSFVREGKGAEETAAYAALLPKIPAKAQALLIAALGDRGDPAAIPAIVAATKSEDAAVRVAALQALGQVGDATSIPVLIQIATTTKDPERKAASDSLDRVRGQGTDAAILKATEDAAPNVRAELIRCLAARRYAEAVPTFIKAAEDADPAVRLEAVKALGVLADEKCLPAIVGILVKAQGDPELQAAEKSTQAIAAKIADADKRLEPILGALAGASPAAKGALLRVLGRLGGPKALEAVRAALAEAAVHEAALRALTEWPDAAAAPDLVKLAQAAEEKQNLRIIAFRGYVRLAGLPSGRPAKDTLKMYEQAMEIAPTPGEKTAVLSGVAEVKDIGALRLVLPCLEVAALKAPAMAAIVKLGGNLKDVRDKDQRAEIRAALEKVLQEATDKRQSAEAKKALDTYKK